MWLIRVQSALLQSSQFETVTATKSQQLQAITVTLCHCVMFVTTDSFLAQCQVRSFFQSNFIREGDLSASSFNFQCLICHLIAEYVIHIQEHYFI